MPRGNAAQDDRLLMAQILQKLIPGKKQKGAPEVLKTQRYLFVQRSSDNGRVVLA